MRDQMKIFNKFFRKYFIFSFFLISFVFCSYSSYAAGPFERVYKSVVPSNMPRQGAVGLYASYRITDPSSGLYTFGNTYDNALVAIAALKANDLITARRILDFFQIQFNAYGKLSDAYNIDDGSGHVFSRGVITGEMLWVGIALCHYESIVKDKRYAMFLIHLADYIKTFRVNTLDSFEGANPLKGMEGVNAFISTEHNIDAAAFFDMASYITNNVVYLRVSENAKLWLRSNEAYDTTNKKFNRGKKGDGSIDSAFATDTHSWALLALYDDSFFKDKKADLINYIEINAKTSLTNVNGSNLPVTGFDFTNRKTAVSYEWSLHMALAYKLVDRYEDSENMLLQVENIMDSLIGIPYATGQICTALDNSGTPTEGTCKAAGGFITQTEVSVAPLMWYLFAENNFNPFVLAESVNAGGKTVSGSWSDETLAEGGEYSSLKVDVNGYPRVAYYSAGVSLSLWNGASWFDKQNLNNNVREGKHISVSTDAINSSRMVFYNRKLSAASYLRVSSTTGDIQSSAVLDAVDDKGWYGSIMYGPQVQSGITGHNPHISYYDNTKKDLWYTETTITGVNSSSWTRTLVDDGGTTGDVGKFSSLVVDPFAISHIVYYDAIRNELKYATVNQVRAVAGRIVIAAGGGQYASMAIYQYVQGGTKKYDLHVSYYDSANGDLKYLKKMDAAASGAVWTSPPSTVDSGGDVGRYSSIAVDKSGNPHIVYQDSTNKSLKYAKWNGSSWVLETVFKWNSDKGITGIRPSIAVDQYNVVHVAYYDLINNSLKYAKKVNPVVVNFNNSSVPNDPTEILGIMSETYSGHPESIRLNGPNQNGSLNKILARYIPLLGIPISSVDLIASTQAGTINDFVEGQSSLKVRVRDGGGFFINFGGDNSQAVTDLSDGFGWTEEENISGTIEFSLKFDPADPVDDLTFKVDVQACSPSELELFSYFSCIGRPLLQNGQWQKVSIPISQSRTDNCPSVTLVSCLSFVKVPAIFTTSNNGTFWVDNIVWRKRNAGGGGLGVKIKNISDNAEPAVKSISWSSVNSVINIANDTTTWKVADQYIELDLNRYIGVSSTMNAIPSIQIYTNNKAVDASPRYTGTLANPAGLVAYGHSAADPLPLAWRITDSLQPVGMSVRRGTEAVCPEPSGPSKAYPDRLWSPEVPDNPATPYIDAPCYPSFLWMLDRNTFGAGGNQNASFTDGLDYSTVWDIRRGIQHAEGTWLGAASKNYIYLAADFNYALAGRNYSTNKLTIELFYE